jgi:hypothetical protein
MNHPGFDKMNKIGNPCKKTAIALGLKLGQRGSVGPASR